jgi:hypothetical protein
MSQFANTPQSFFYNMNRTTVNTAYPNNQEDAIEPPNPYYTGGYKYEFLSQVPKAIPMTVALAQDAVQPSKNFAYYQLKPFNNRLILTTPAPIGNTQFSPNGENFPTTKRGYFVQK